MKYAVEKITVNLDGAENQSFLVDFSILRSAMSPLLIFIHGFKGFKDWGHYPLLDTFFTEKGISIARMNFSHNGVSENCLREFSRLDLFAENRISYELKDIQKLLEFINDKLSDSVDLSKICLMAHSRGGLSAIAYCAQQAQIRKLITLSSVADISRMWGNYDLEKWKKEGIVYSKNARTAEEMPMKYSLVQDYLSHENLFNPLKAAKKIKIPWLALHGSEDQAVPISEWESLKLSQPNLVSEVIRGADHTLGGKHPWTTNQLPEQCEFAMNIVADFILKNS